MTLLDLCEPLFQQVCQLKRMGRSNGQADYLRVRHEIKGLLADLAQNSAADGKLSSQYRKLELSLVFFVDSMLANSKLGLAGQWHQNRLAYEQKEKAGDEKFFDLLEVTLADSSEEAEERLAIFYVCLGLGFEGMYIGQPEPLRKYMNAIFPRIRHRVDYEAHSRICEDAYKTVDTRSFLRPPGHRILVLAMVFVFLSLSVLVLYYGMYMNASDTLRASLRQVVKQDQSK
jgi:type IV/VI secretion system ImpK/VasF family protein